ARDAEPVGRSGAESCDALARNGNRAAVGMVRSRDDLDQGAFAGAVFTEQRMHFAGAQIEVDTPQCPRAAERFGELAEFKDRMVGHLRGSEGGEMAAEAIRPVKSRPGLTVRSFCGAQRRQIRISRGQLR